MPDKPFREIVGAMRDSVKELRGTIKLRGALDHFEVEVSGRICLDVGASTGGFTTALLEREARKVYAVDVGHGQLLGSLRQDARVANLESTNVGDLTTSLVPDAIDLVTVDVSYLSLAAAVEQIGALSFASGAELVGLVKPMFGAPSCVGADRSSVARSRAGPCGRGDHRSWVGGHRDDGLGGDRREGCTRALHSR